MKNIIDIASKLASIGIYHNFDKNPLVTSFDSKIANDIFRKLTSESAKRVTVNDHKITEFNSIVLWLKQSCTGYFVMIDRNVYFQKDCDKAAFILQFINP